MTPAQPTALVEVTDARARVIIALRQIERDVRVTDLTDAEIDSIVEAANAGVRLAALEEAARVADHFAETAWSEGLSEDVVMARSYTASDIATAIRKAKDLSHE